MNIEIDPIYIETIFYQLNNHGESVFIYENEYIQIFKDQDIDGQDIFRYFCYDELGLKHFDSGKIKLPNAKDAIEELIQRLQWWLFQKK